MRTSDALAAALPLDEDLLARPAQRLGVGLGAGLLGLGLGLDLLSRVLMSIRKRSPPIDSMVWVRGLGSQRVMRSEGLGSAKVQRVMYGPNGEPLSLHAGFVEARLEWARE